MKRILSPVRRAIEDYNMIEEGERIAVGVSGGKDSITLLVALHQLSRFHNKKFSVVGITLDMGIEGMDISPLVEFAKEQGIELIVKKTNINEVVFKIRQEEHPCSLCALLRRGALNDTALENGIKKIALGHHFDDVVETFMLNLFFEGRLGCFRPYTYLDRKDITIIRPLIYLPEKDIKSCVKRQNYPVIFNPCEANGKTERESMKTLLKTLEITYPGLRKRLFGALQRSKIDGWKETVKARKT